MNLKLMKCNYKIYEETSGEMPETDVKIAEQILITKIKQSYEQPKRIVIRPKISVWKDVILLILTLAAIVVSLILILKLTGISQALFSAICILSGVLYLAVFSKKLLITAIIIYQKYAPEFIRSSGVYYTKAENKSCSDYCYILPSNLTVIKNGRIKNPKIRS